MKWMLILALCAGACAAEPSGKWTTRDGQAFDAELLAADGLRATFSTTGKPPFTVPLAALSGEGLESIRVWREDWRRPLIVPTALTAWPAQSAPAVGEATLRGEDAGVFTYESANFRLISDLKLPPGIATDVSRVFEATRSALIAMPLGLHAGGEKERYPVMLFRDTSGYAAAGGPSGSGGFYDGRSRRMLILLPNLGIGPTQAGMQFSFAKSVFVLKHEVTHQLMARWHPRLPMWASEGIAEFVASLPYAQGRYTLQFPGAGMRDYLLKWRKTRDSRSIRFIPPERLMSMRAPEWNAAVNQQEAYDLYNSAALLAYYFIQQDGGAPLAGFLDAVRRNEEPGAAENAHLLRGKTRESLAAEVTALAKKLGVELVP